MLVVKPLETAPKTMKLGDRWKEMNNNEAAVICLREQVQFICIPVFFILYLHHFLYMYTA